MAIAGNQSTFITGNGPASLLCILADASGYSLKHAFNWKWQHFRKLRPDAFGLWIHDIKTGLVENENNFDISNIILDNKVLDDNVEVNANGIRTTYHIHYHKPIVKDLHYIQHMYLATQ